MTRFSDLPPDSSLTGSEIFAASDGGASKSVTLNQVRNYGSTSNQIVNLREYGASLNGVDSDAAALDAVVAAYPLGGVEINWTGYLRLDSGWTPPAGMSNVVLRPLGDGYIYNPAHGFDFLTLPTTVAGWFFDRVKFFTDSGASGATTRYFLVNNSNDFTAYEFWGRNCWSGIYHSGSKGYLRGRSYLNAIKPASGVGLVVAMGANEVFEAPDLYFENAVASDCLAGAEIISGNSVVVGGIGAKCGTPLLLNPGVSDVIATLRIDGFNGDTSAQNGCTFGGTGAIQRVEGYLRASSNAGHGLYITNPPDSADLKVRAVDNGTNGVYLNYAGSLNNSRFDVMAFGNNVHGFEAVSGAVDWTARVIAGDGDGFGGNGQYGGVIGALCDHFTMDIDGVGDTTALLFNGAGTGATKVVRSRS